MKKEINDLIEKVTGLTLENGEAIFIASTSKKRTTMVVQGSEDDVYCTFHGIFKNLSEDSRLCRAVLIAFAKRLLDDNDMRRKFISTLLAVRIVQAREERAGEPDLSNAPAMDLDELMKNLSRN